MVDRVYASHASNPNTRDTPSATNEKDTGQLPRDHLPEVKTHPGQICIRLQAEAVRGIYGTPSGVV